MGNPSIDFDAIMAANRKKQREEALASRAPGSDPFIAVTSCLYLEIIHCDTGSYIAVDTNPEISQDPTAVEELIHKMKAQLIENLSKAEVDLNIA